MSVYRVTEIIGTSSTSWEDAAAEAIRTAAGTLRDLRVADAGGRLGGRVPRRGRDWEPAIAHLGSVRLVVSWPGRLHVERERAGPAGPHVLDMLFEVELVEQGGAFGY